jgi:formate dehydrogenase major subunit
VGDCRLTPTFQGVDYEKLDRLGSIQWPCNDAAPDGTPTMHVGTFVRGKGRFCLTEYVATSERVTSRYPLILTTGRVLFQYNVGAQTRRTANLAWHHEDRLDIHPDDAESRGIEDGDWVGISSRTGDTLCAGALAHGAGVVYTTFHFGIRANPSRPRTGLGDQLPGIQGDTQVVGTQVRLMAGPHRPERGAPRAWPTVGVK